MSNNVIDIIERFQTRHALQEEREMNNFHASTNGAVAPGMPDENGRSKASIFEMEEVRVWTAAVPRNTEWSSPHDGQDRMVVTLGRIRQLPRESDSAFAARWACIPANSDCKVANEAERTMNLMIVEFIDGNDEEKISQTEKVERNRPRIRPTVLEPVRDQIQGNVQIRCSHDPNLNGGFARNPFTDWRYS